MTAAAQSEPDESVARLTADLPRRLRRAQQVGALIAVVAFALGATLVHLAGSAQFGVRDAVAGALELLAAVCLGAAAGDFLTLRKVNRAIVRTLQPAPTGRRIRAAVQGKPLQGRRVVLDDDEHARAVRYAGLAAAALPAQGLAGLTMSFAVLFNGLALFVNDLDSRERADLPVTAGLVTFLIAGLIVVSVLQPLHRRAARHAAAYLREHGSDVQSHSSNRAERQP